MYENLQIFSMADAMARHAGLRQTIVAQNMANADTPDYKARDILPFADTLDTSAPLFGQKATRAAHLNGARGIGMPVAEETSNAWMSPNGNSVSLEAEMLKGVEVKGQHDRALAIYKNALALMRTSLGRG